MRAGSKRRIALVGADTLLGREIKEVAESAGVAVDSFAANGEANFGDEEGEAVFRNALDATAIEGSDAIVLAGAAEGAKKALDLAAAHQDRLKVIDCTGALDQHPEARIWGGGVPVPHNAWLLIAAHPAADLIATVLRMLGQYQPLAQAVIEIFEPASERGRLGMAELQQQTAGLLSFKALEKKIYDTQVSFAMVPAYGEASPYRLEAIEQRIERHIASLIGSDAAAVPATPMPSLRLIQAPVFHGHTISAWIEFASHPDPEKIAGVLASSGIDVRTAEHEMPTNAGVAGQSGISAGDIRIDRNNARAIWLWAVADNFRIVADRVEQLLSSLESTGR